MPLSPLRFLESRRMVILVPFRKIAAGKDEPFVDENRIVSRRASQGAPRNFPLLHYIVSYSIIPSYLAFDKIDSYHIVCNVFVPNANAWGWAGAFNRRFANENN